MCSDRAKTVSYTHLEDALEFIMAGATAVSVGTANFFNPYATVEIADGIQAFLEKQKVEDINELIGVVK